MRTEAKWALTQSDLYYGDVFGGAPICVAAYELDGVEYTMRRGLPFPTHEDGAPDSLEIIALTPASLGECDRWEGAVALGASKKDEWDTFIEELGEFAPNHLRDRAGGCGMIATFTRGRGTVFNAGSTDWVKGLAQRDPFTECIMRNVLNRFGARA